MDSLRRVLKVRMEQRRVELGRYLQQQQQHLGDRLLQQQRQRHQALVGAGGVGGGRARSMSMPTAPREAAAAMPPPPPPRPAAAAAPAADFASALQELTRQGRLGPGAARLLTGLHARGHEALAAAWTRFGRNGDEAALVDACQRVARVVASAAKAAAEGQGQEEQEARTTAAAAVPAVVPAEAGGDASATLTATGAARRAQTRTAILTQSLDLLLSRGSLDLRGYRALARRLQAEDAALLGALDGFLGNRDVEALLRRLAVLARPHPLPGSNGGEGGGGGGGGLNGGGRQTAAGGRLPSPIRTRVVAAAVAGATGPEAEEEETGSFATDRAVRMPPPATNPNMRRAAVAGAALEADDDQSTIATAATPTPLRVVEDGTPPEPPLRLGAEDREELLDILVSTGCLAEPERALLAAAARRGERALLGVFDAFARTQDVGRFQRSLRKYALILKAARVLNGGEGPGQGQGLPARSPIGERPRGLSDLTLDEEELLPPSEEGLGNVAKQLGSLSLAPLAGGEGQQEAGGGK